MTIMMKLARGERKKEEISSFTISRFRFLFSSHTYFSSRIFSLSHFLPIPTERRKLFASFPLVKLLFLFYGISRFTASSLSFFLVVFFQRESEREEIFQKRVRKKTFEMLWKYFSSKYQLVERKVLK